MNIHSTAVVSKNAKIAKDVEIGPYVIIEDGVEIGSRVKIYAQAQILKGTIIGADSQVHMGVILGHLPQIRDLAEKEAGGLIIGQRNIFREYSTIHCSSNNKQATIIGTENYFMGFSHVAHDCVIGNHVTICNGVLIAGHAHIEDYVFISGNVTVHQFCRIGRLAMVGGLARVAKDIPPFMLVKGDSLIWAINSVGIKRANLSLEDRRQIKEAFRILYKSNLNVKQAIAALQQNLSAEVKHLVDFICNSRRGICAYKSRNFWQNVGLWIADKKAKNIAEHRWFIRNRKAQEPLALALLIVAIALLFILFNRQFKEAIKNKYHQLIQEAQDNSLY